MTTETAVDTVSGGSVPLPSVNGGRTRPVRRARVYDPLRGGEQPIGVI
ncbi:hypothetical protein [Streptomyces sp. NPDC058440]